ncbi:tagatose-6-phosphate kinase [Mammaliicoccus fleurettii]|uniref:tagatose-6-phosphate kinase n=1 Tax=Mammaliicoccus fleurettii TaxID=150056 RepID=UPI002DB63754|nr:tagatose-6-phosphate kinase [Mammaliicoccus fleurettii]MEB8068579.1 tagatose-6-phosphate kinase [Mammaliicoccus fleurettii]
MILTITMNPSVDISYQVDNLSINHVNRTNKWSKTAGGKGLNVTRVLNQLNEQVVASGLKGGKLGEYLEQSLNEHKITNHFFEIQGNTRNCIAILHEGNQTEILEDGPTISSEEIEHFKAHFEELVSKSDIAVISGSLPKGVDSKFYSNLIKICDKHAVTTILDCSNKALIEVLRGQYKPLLIKPNIDELSELLGEHIDEDIESLKQAVANPMFENIEWVVVSLGSNGVFAKHNDKYYKVDIPQIQVVNPVGSGDSMIAGFTSALMNNATDEALLKKANTIGMLNAQETVTGSINLKNYDDLYNKINIIEV